jgi:hypothetical protein
MDDFPNKWPDFLTNWYRRDGTPYPRNQEGWREMMADWSNPKVRVVRQDKLANGYWVSTVWLGYNHQWNEARPPLIFETMVKNPDGDFEDHQERYSTENDAIIGHMKAMDLYAQKPTPQ